MRLFRAHFGPMQEPFVGALPSDPKIDAPVPPDATLVGSVVHRHPLSVTVYADTDLAAADVLAFYEREYGARGWRAQKPAMPPMAGGGFVSRGFAGGPPDGRVFCKGEDEPYYQVAVMPVPPRIRLSYHAKGPGMYHPCSTQPSDRGMHGPPQDTMPRLEAPAGVAVRGGGGGGSSDEWSTYGSALTTMPAEELMDHFVRGIEAQGHELLERGAGDRVAWSRWRMKKKGWEGFLVVAAQRPDLRHLTFLTYTEGAIENIRAWQQYSTGWSSRMIGG